METNVLFVDFIVGRRCNAGPGSLEISVRKSLLKPVQAGEPDGNPVPAAQDGIGHLVPEIPPPASAQFRRGRIGVQDWLPVGRLAGDIVAGLGHVEETPSCF